MPTLNPADLQALARLMGGMDEFANDTNRRVFLLGCGLEQFQGRLPPGLPTNAYCVLLIRTLIDYGSEIVDGVERPILVRLLLCLRDHGQVQGNKESRELIDRLLREWLPMGELPRPPEAVGTSQPLRPLGGKLTILIVGSSPLNIDPATNQYLIAPLDIAEEVSRIEHRLRIDALATKTQVTYKPSLVYSELITYVLQTRPDILHFSGHGMQDGSLVVKNERNEPHFLSPATLVELIRIFQGEIRLVFLNACWSDVLADALIDDAPSVDAVIGMQAPIGDESARVFSAAFYEYLARSESVSRAFDLARVQLMGMGSGYVGVPKLRATEAGKQMRLF